MAARVLSDTEVSEFRLIHAYDILVSGLPDPGESRYVMDDNYGAVLLFGKLDGTILFVATGLNYDPSIQDPSTIGYVTEQTLKSVGENAGAVLNKVASLATTVAVAVAIYYGYKIISGK